MGGAALVDIFGGRMLSGMVIPAEKQPSAVQSQQ